jgi:hypothetical protein
MRPFPWLKGGFSLLLFIFWGWLAHSAVAQQSGITTPASDETLTGVVTVTGTAVHPAFLRYELAFLNEDSPDAGWIVFAEGDQPVTNGTLAIWDTTVGRNVGAPVFPDGRYQLRLRVVKTDYNYDEFYATNLTISNGGPTPIPTPDETAPAATAVPGGGQSSEQQVEGTAVFNPATALPSLTPFPTLTPQATPVAIIENAPSDPAQTENGGGIFGQLQAVNAGRFAAAFWGGVRLTLLIFGLLFLYLLLRSIGRRLWRKFWVGRT